MRIEITDGCYGRNIIVDGTVWYSLPPGAIKSISKEVINKITKEYEGREYEMIIDLLYLIESDINKVDDDPCDQCGSYFQSDIYEI